MAHRVGTYSGFCTVQLGVFLLFPPQWDASPSQGYMYITLLNLPVFIYPPEWKEVVRVKYLAQDIKQYNVASQGSRPDCSN